MLYRVYHDCLTTCMVFCDFISTTMFNSDGIYEIGKGYHLSQSTDGDTESQGGNLPNSNSQERILNPELTQSQCYSLLKNKVTF